MKNPGKSPLVRRNIYYGRNRKFRRDRCKGCELCTLVCPKHIIVMDESTTNRKGYHPPRCALKTWRMRGLRQLRQNLSRFYHHRRTHIRRILWRKNCGKAMRPLPRPPFVPAANTSSAIPSPRKTKFLNICPPPAQVGGCFIQAESEVAAINMVYGAAGCGVRAMTSSSSPRHLPEAGGHHLYVRRGLPAVIIEHDARSRPGHHPARPGRLLLEATRGGGNGDYRHLVFAPATIQEAADYVQIAFDVADYYYNPVMVLADGMIGQDDGGH